RDTGYNYVNILLTEPLKAGNEYTFSSEVEVAEGNFDVITVLKRKMDGSSNGSVGDLPIINGRIEGTFTASEGDARLYIYMGKSGKTNNNKAILRKAKLEKGNKATDWTPAPEDVQEQIDEAKQEAKEAKQEAQQAQTTADGKNSVFTQSTAPST